MEDDSDHSDLSDGHSEEMKGLGSTSPPDSDSLEDPYRSNCQIFYSFALKHVILIICTYIKM